MSKLLKNTIIKTVEEMILVDGDMGWIREEVECMFDQEFTKREWDDITLQALVRRAFTRPLPEA